MKAELSHPWSRALQAVRGRWPGILRLSLTVGGWLIVASVLFPVALVVLGTSLAVPRYVLRLPMEACLILVVAVAVAAIRAAHGRIRWPPLSMCLPWAVSVALVSHWLWSRLWVAETHGLLTVGGGDAGHHMAIARQLSSAHPQIYVGQTGLHACAWLLGSLCGGELPDAMAWAWIGGALTCVALVLGAVAVALRDASKPVQTVGLCMAAALMVQLSDPYVPMWMHYYQAEGFFAQLHGLVPVSMCLLACASFDRWWMRLLCLTAAVGLLRFTYALNLSESLVALAVMGLLGAPWRSWRALAAVLPVAGACLWGAWLAGDKLWAMRAMKGGLMEHDLYAETVHLGVLTTTALGLAGLGALCGWRWRLRGLTRLSRVALWLALLGAWPWWVHHHWDNHLELPREYYFRKHATLAMMTFALALPAIAAAMASFVIQRRAALVFVVLCVATLHFSEVVVDAQARASKRIAWSYKERVDPKVRWRINTPLWEPQVMAKMRAVLAQTGAHFGGYLHPSWPVHSAMNSSFPGWRGQPKRTVVDIKELRWREWLRGFEARPGTCRFFTAGTAQLRAYRRHDRAMKAGTSAYVASLLRGPGLRCWPWRSERSELPPQKLCWRCEPSKKLSSASPRVQ